MAGVATAVTVGLAAKNLLDSNKEYSNQKKTLKQQRRLDIANRRNLLDEHLASRRARIGAMGLNSVGSSTAVENRLIKNHYREDAIEENNHRNQLIGLKNARNSQMNKGIASGAQGFSSGYSSMIK